MANFEMQKAEKIKIEDLAREKLDGERLTELVEFLEFIKSEKISMPWASINAFRMKYKSKNIGTISFLGKGDWGDGIIEARNHLRFKINVAEWSAAAGDDKFADGVFKEGLQDIIWDNIVSCRHCYPANNPCSRRDSTKIIFGKEIKGICGSSGRFHIHFVNPGKKEMDCIKKLIDIIKPIVDENAKK